jgi:hypothetical protein
MMYHGCEQSRKLLAHYRRCRTLRSRLATNGSNLNAQQSTASTSASTALSHHCLVCSLVARQARTMLEHRTAPPPTTTTNGMNVFKSSSSSSTHMKRNIFSSSATTRQKMASSTYTVLSTANNDKLLLMNGRNGHKKSERDTPALKMPPPPPRTMMNGNDSSNNIGGSNNNLNDSLARLYATAKQLDTVTSSQDRPIADMGDNNDHLDMYPAVLPVVRRERSVSDTELFHYNETTLPVVEMNHHDKDGTNDTMMMMVVVDDHEEGDIDEMIHAAATTSGMSYPTKQRIRSASCGSGTTTTITKKAVVSLSPSHYCETIVEEEL